jgi:hypothetical protein
LQEITWKGIFRGSDIYVFGVGSPKAFDVGQRGMLDGFLIDGCAGFALCRTGEVGLAIRYRVRLVLLGMLFNSGKKNDFD